MITRLRTLFGRLFGRSPRNPSTKLNADAAREIPGPRVLFARAARAVVHECPYDRSLGRSRPGNHNWTVVPYDYIQEPAGARITPLKDVEQCIGCRRYRVAGRLLDPSVDMDEVVRLAGGKSQFAPDLANLAGANFVAIDPPKKSKKGESASNKPPRKTDYRFHS